MDRTVPTWSLSFILLVAFAGCAGGKQPNLLSRWTGGGASSMKSPGSSDSERILAQHQSNTGQQKSWSQSVSSAFFNMGKAITPEGGTASVKDEISLSSTPGRAPTEVYLEGARFLETKGNLEQAQAQYEMALKQDPKNQTALISYARHLDRRNLAPLAEKAYERALAVDPKNATVHNDLGLFYASRDRLPEAAAHLQKAATLSPDRALYRNNLARVLVLQGRVDLARAQLSAVLPAEVAEYNLGVLLSQANRPEEASACLRTALRMKPDFGDAAQLLASLPSVAAEGSYPVSPVNVASSAQRAQVYLGDVTPPGGRSSPVASVAEGPYAGEPSPAAGGDFNNYSSPLTAPELNRR